MSSTTILENSSNVYAYRATLNASTAVPLGESTADLTELMLQADLDNTEIVKVGSAGVQCYQLEPGDVLNAPVRNPALLYGISVSGTQYVNLIGRFGV